MGHVRKIEDSQGRVRYQARWVERKAGRKVKRQATFDRRKDADDHIAAHRVDTARGTALDTDARRTPFGTYADSWLQAKTPDIKARTYEGYESALDKYVRPYFADTPVGHIDVKAAREFRVWLIKQPAIKTPRSVEWVWYPFRAVLDLAAEDRALPFNPARLIKTGRPKNAPKFKPHFLTAEQIEAIATHLHNDDRAPYDLMVRFLAYTGLRAAELAGLNVEDLTLMQRTDSSWLGKVHVHRTRRKVKGGWRTDTPKSERSTRKVRLPSWLAEDMHGYVTTQHPNPSPGTPLWPNRRPGGYSHGRRGSKVQNSAPVGRGLNWAEPVEPNAFYRSVVKPAFKAAGVPGARLHDLRHTFASLWLTAGGDIYRLSEAMGHASYRVTLDVYAHLVPEDDDAPTPLDARPVPTTDNIIQLRRMEGT